MDPVLSRIYPRPPPSAPREARVCGPWEERLFPSSTNAACLDLEVSACGFGTHVDTHIFAFVYLYIYLYIFKADFIRVNFYHAITSVVFSLKRSTAKSLRGCIDRGLTERLVLSHGHGEGTGCGMYADELDIRR